MRVRGRRECLECGERWSYFETGSPNCPHCGSLRSRGTDAERSRHTDAPVDLSLESVARAIDEAPLRELASNAADECRAYCARRGFIDAGDLLPLDDRYLAAAELRAVGDDLATVMDPDPTVETYFYDLLATARDGERPDPDAVPPALRSARGLAIATSVEAYRRAMAQWLADRDRGDTVPELGSLETHERRLYALDGDVDPREAETLLTAARELGTSLRDDDEGARARAASRLDGLAE